MLEFYDYNFLINTLISWWLCSGDSVMVPKAHGCMWGAKASPSRPIPQNSCWKSSCCIATNQSKCPCCPMSTTESVYNGHVTIWTGPWINKRIWLGLMNHICFSYRWPGVSYLPRDELVAVCTRGRSWTIRGKVMLWAKFCLETLGPGTHVDETFTCTTFLKTKYIHSWQ